MPSAERALTLALDGYAERKVHVKVFGRETVTVDVASASRATASWPAMWQISADASGSVVNPVTGTVLVLVAPDGAVALLPCSRRKCP